MRSNLKKGVILILLAIFALSVVTQVTAETKKKYTIGYTCIGWTIPWMVYYKQVWQQEAKNYPNIDVIWHDAEGDPKKMIDGLEGFISQKVDMIMCFADDDLPILETYKKIKAAHIPLVLTMDPPDYKAFEYMTSYSGIDTREFARICAEAMNDSLGGKGKVAFITGTIGTSSERQYSDGFMDALRHLDSKIELVTKQSGEWDVTKAQAAATDILTKYPRIDGIYASDDWMGGGVVRALKEKGYKPGQVKLVAPGGSKIGLKDFKEGWYVAQQDQGPGFCAKQDIWLASVYFEGKLKSLPKIIAVQTPIITKENVDTYPASW
jgi:ribose transport system substrate-binding protein